ncbi:glycosyltransferase family 39 protein [Jatrophihabitans telluris]|uniref:Glycosyltransferase family 39 protein n=1 Tax=Jatrophihabitans telluris TaxID=2038343 RepID=A0ABY4QVZ7_9ACTN|nr:glycosyltransferase family 39 protein [Jatrophihabitans telluris]UQX87836.1 glycosyltransferase family 39 protein [Jatrophihabitans telluris]
MTSTLLKPTGRGHRRPATSGSEAHDAGRPADLGTGEAGGGSARSGRLNRLWTGEPADPRWARPSLLAMLVVTAVGYLYNLGASTTANSFYAAAVQAGTQSWKAFFFGSFDSSNYITVDKPPASLWVMELSGRIFGFNSWSMLAPQALEGVIAVGLVYGALRRASGPAAGLFAGATLALTPAAALMFRFNNPDAFLVLLLVAGAYCLVRALQSGRTAWLVLVGACVGFGFLTKMGQALLVVPAVGLAYLIAGPTRLGRRLVQLIAGGIAMVLSAGWWVAIVELMPASDRPYIGGSTDNSILNLAFGYNGLGRLFGGSGNGGGGGGNAVGNASFGGATGIGRLFNQQMAQQISWLLPAALIALVSGLWMTRRAPRTDLVRASLILWGGWLIVTGLVFSYMQGTIHPYYTVALAPAVAGLVAITGTVIWRQRLSLTAQLSGVAMLGATGIWTFHLLNQTPSWFPVLRYAAAALAIFGSVVLLMQRHFSRAALIAGVAAGAVVLSGSGAYAVATTTVAHTGSTPNVGTAAASGGGFGGGSAPGGARGLGGTPPTGTTGPTSTSGTGNTSGAGNTDTGSTSSALISLLKASNAKWAAAASSSMTAGSLELDSGQAVMSIGGFNGSDNAITLAQFKALVAKGEIGYFIGSGSGGLGGGGGGGGGTTAYSAIAAWVASNYTASTVGGTTVYALAT